MFAIRLFFAVVLLMTTTSPNIWFGTNDALIREDIDTINDFSTKASYSNLDNLETGVRTTKPYATFEPDFWKLDGSYHFMPSTGVNVGYVGNTLSDGSGNFPSSPYPLVRIDFNGLHSTSQITIYFSTNTGDYASEIILAVYNGASVVHYQTHYPTSSTFTLNTALTNFDAIVVYFVKSSKPYRFARMEAVDFDEVTRFTDANIRDAKLTETVDPLSTELPYSELQLSMLSDDDAFDITDPTNDFVTFSEGQPVRLFKNINNELIQGGKFYILRDGWKTTSANMASMQCGDTISQLDKIVLPYRVYDDSITLGWRLDNFMEYILGYFGIPFEIESSIAHFYVFGWMPRGTVREMLQQILFSAGAYMTCSKTGILQIKKFDQTVKLAVYDYIFSKSDKGINSSLSISPRVDGVRVLAHEWRYDGMGYQEVFSKNFTETGVYLAKLNSVCANDYTVSGSATITEAGVDYVKLNVTGTGVVTVMGHRNYDSTTVYEVLSPGFSSITNPNVVEINNAYYVIPDYAAAVAQRVYNYYQLRYHEHTKLFSPLVVPGDSVYMSTQSDKHIGGIVEKVVTDLSGGMVADVDVRGGVS